MFAFKAWVKSNSSDVQAKSEKNSILWQTDARQVQYGDKNVRVACAMTNGTKNGSMS
jgi:hypothetical protein